MSTDINHDIATFKLPFFGNNLSSYEYMSFMIHVMWSSDVFLLTLCTFFTNPLCGFSFSKT